MTNSSLTELGHAVERHLVDDAGGWCDAEKANNLASWVAALRPKVVVEIGVWQGGSLIPMALGLKHNKSGIAIGIDPWSAAASVVDEDQVNADWWGKQDHNAAYKVFLDRVQKHELSPYVQVWRQKSDDVSPPHTIDLLHVDGNHTDQAIRDVDRFGSAVRIGGIMVLDDINWANGAVSRAHTRARSLGFIELYRTGVKPGLPGGTCVVMQRTDPAAE